MSSNFVIDINNKQQRTLILDICFRILSFPYQEETETLFLDFYEFSSYDDVEELLQRVFRVKNINIMCIKSASEVKMEFRVTYRKNIIDNIMPIIKVWYKPCVKELQRQHDVKIKEWKENYDMHHTEDVWKCGIINNHNILPGFKYLVDFKWGYNDDNDNICNVCGKGVGDLVFGSDYGIYLVLETKWLNFKHGEIARRDKKDGIKIVRKRAQKYKELAKKRFSDCKVIGISYTNDKKQGELDFVDTTDDKIFNAIKKIEIGQSNARIFYFYIVFYYYSNNTFFFLG
jgi:hypothetical protein